MAGASHGGEASRVSHGAQVPTPRRLRCEAVHGRASKPPQPALGAAQRRSRGRLGGGLAAVSRWAGRRPPAGRACRDHRSPRWEPATAARHQNVHFPCTTKGAGTPYPQRRFRARVGVGGRCWNRSHDSDRTPAAPGHPGGRRCPRPAERCRRDSPVWSMDATETTALIEQLLGAEAQLAELKARAAVPRDPDRPARRHRRVLDRELARGRHPHHPGAGPPGHPARRSARDPRTHACGARRGPGPRRAGRSHPPSPRRPPRRPRPRPRRRKPSGTCSSRPTSHDAKALKVLGRRILDVVDPDAADAHEAKLLEKEERDAQAATRLVMYDDGHGQVHGTFTAARVRRRRAQEGPIRDRRPHDTRPATARSGNARTDPRTARPGLLRLVARYPTKKLPKAGGLNATAVVLIPLETLMGGLKAAHLDTGETISPAPSPAPRL